jgi:hypothetical protein
MHPFILPLLQIGREEYNYFRKELKMNYNQPELELGIPQLYNITKNGSIINVGVCE